MSDELSPQERGLLLANIDRQQKDDFDEDFYILLKESGQPGIEDIESRKRRALTKYLNEIAEALCTPPPEIDPSIRTNCMIMGAFINGFLDGYRMGQKTEGSILREANT